MNEHLKFLNASQATITIKITTTIENVCLDISVDEEVTPSTLSTLK